jgi:hypothetical protein
MKRIVKLFLPAAFVLFVCLAGSAQAQQGSTAASPGKEPGKAEATAGNTDDNVAEIRKKQEKARAEARDKLELQLEELKMRKSRLQDQQRQLRVEVYKRCGMSPENVVPSLLNIEREILTARIDLAAKESINGTLAKQIAESAEKTKKNLDDDPVLKNLKSLDHDRAEAVQILEGRFKIGTVSYEDLSKAKAELSEAKIRLALREEESTKGNGDAGTAKFNSLIRENSLAISQIQVRLTLLLSESNKLRGARDLVDQYTDLTESEIPRLNRLIDRMSEKLLDEKAW